MAHSFQKVSDLPQVILPAGHAVKPDDVGTAVVMPAIPISKVLGFSEFRFDFFNEGGPDNLKPGRPTTQTASFTPPGGAGGDVVSAFPWLNAVSGAFVTDGVNVTERPFGQFLVDVGISGSTISCTIVLTDSNADDPVKVTVRGVIVFFF